MLNSTTIALAIARPCEEVYEFLLEPTNFSKWAFTGEVNMRHLGGQDWAVETSVGPRILRLARRNKFGVLDHFSMLAEGDAPHPIGMRVMVNGEGTELIYTCFQRATMGDSEFASMVEWITTDLMALKSLLEAHEE